MEWTVKKSSVFKGYIYIVSTLSTNIYIYLAWKKLTQLTCVELSRLYIDISSKWWTVWTPNIINPYTTIGYEVYTEQKKVDSRWTVGIISGQ